MSGQRTARNPPEEGGGGSAAPQDVVVLPGQVSTNFPPKIDSKLGRALFSSCARERPPGTKSFTQSHLQSEMCNTLSIRSVFLFGLIIIFPRPPIRLPLQLVRQPPPRKPRTSVGTSSLLLSVNSFDGDDGKKAKQAAHNFAPEQVTPSLLPEPAIPGQLSARNEGDANSPEGDSGPLQAEAVTRKNRSQPIAMGNGADNGDGVVLLGNGDSGAPGVKEGVQVTGDGDEKKQASTASKVEGLQVSLDDGISRSPFQPFTPPQPRGGSMDLGPELISSKPEAAVIFPPSPPTSPPIPLPVPPSDMPKPTSTTSILQSPTRRVVPKNPSPPPAAPSAPSRQGTVATALPRPVYDYDPTPLPTPATDDTPRGGISTGDEAPLQDFALKAC